MLLLFTVQEWFQIGFWMVSASGIVFGVITYYRNLKLRRAEWLKSLFEKFYENPQYKTIRHKIDAGNELIKEEDLVDYLNFFEFVASLWKLNQIKKYEVLMLFEYYLNLLNNHQEIYQYIEKYGFENLISLLKIMSKQKK
ncbi:MAG: hypothetical protein H7Y04_04680 [Verrucomicrobia bacterium]|nr:hypothetical protein [Cytophagales bacterium]